MDTFGWEGVYVCARTDITTQSESEHPVLLLSRHANETAVHSRLLTSENKKVDANNRAQHTSYWGTRQSTETHPETCSHTDVWRSGASTGNFLGDGSRETFDVVNQEKQGMKKQAKTNGAVHRRGSKGAKTGLLWFSTAAEQIHLQSCDLSFYHSPDEHKSRFSISIFRPQGHPCINSEIKQDSSSLLIRFLILKTGLLLYMSTARLKSPRDSCAVHWPACYSKEKWDQVYWH